MRPRGCLPPELAQHAHRSLPDTVVAGGVSMGTKTKTGAAGSNGQDGSNGPSPLNGTAGTERRPPRQ